MSGLLSRAALAAAIAALPCGQTAIHGKTIRPLFVQVHITSPVADVRSETLGRILRGGDMPIREFGGPQVTAHITADDRIAGALRRAYPALKCAVRSFDNDALAADRKFLGISDVRGLRPHFRIVAIDGAFPWGTVREDGAPGQAGTYPLSLKGAVPWDPDRHVTVVQTGVTAMTRAFIPAAEAPGDPLAPIRHVRAITDAADLAMTSNEVSFLESCSYPLKNRMVFCAPLRFFRLLKEAGFDVIELTGNHNNDYGRGPNRDSIALMREAGMTYFGGGLDRADAEKVRYVTVKGTVFAFVGFNECGPPAAWATDDAPGAARLSRELFERSVAEASARADAVFVSVQWCNENDPVPTAAQRAFFRRAAELGATVMVSSSAHRPMGLEFHRGRFVSYGLGNFLFDQMQSINHRRGLIARHHFYRGRHAATELIPYLIHNSSQPRPSAGAEARATMEEVFRHSRGAIFGR